MFNDSFENELARQIYMRDGKRCQNVVGCCF